MGLILTTLIRTAPPMAAVFFQGTLGTFMAYSQIGGGAAATPSSDGRPPGQHTPAQTADQSRTNASVGQNVGAVGGYGVGNARGGSVEQGTGKYGNAGIG
jgi:type IV secretion system protein VirB6